MVDIIYFSSQIQTNGELKLVRQDKHLDLNPAPRRVDGIIRDKPPLTHADPTLTVFYEPKEAKRD